MSKLLDRLHQTVPIPSIDNRPSDYEYALMSQLAYRAMERNTNTLTTCPQELHDLHWKILEECKAKSEGGYSGIILKNEQRKQLVLAHRGTLLDFSRKFESFRTVYEDINGIYRQKITPQKEAVHKYTRKVVKLLDQSEYKDYHLSFTGHSLGGLLAELSVFFVHNEIRVSEYIHVNAVTFESPGSQSVIEELQSNTSSGRVSVKDLDIVGYVTYPNVINTFNRHIGTLYSINVDFGIKLDKSSFRRWLIPGNPLAYTMKTHTIDNIVKWFKSLESNLESERLLMTDWPLGLQYRKLFDTVLKPTGGIYAVSENEDNEFFKQYKAHFVPNADLGRWNVLSLTQLCKNTKEILEQFNTYEFVSKRDNVSKNANVIMTELKDCCTFQDGISSDLRFLILSEDKFQDLNKDFGDDNVHSRSYDVAHQFRYIFTKFVSENVQHQPTALPTKWWPGVITTIQRVVDRKIDGELTIEKIKELLDGVEDNSNNGNVLVRKLVLSGMGGTGKTTTAKAFGVKYQQHYKFIIWIDCGEQNLEKSLRELSTAMQHKHISSTRMDAVVPAIYESIKFVTKCLFIFDNAEDYQSVKYYLPPQDAPHHCLITSRSRYWGNENELGRIEILPIGVFSFEDADTFLKGALKNTNEDERLQLLEAMDRLPLALQIAVATINRQKYSIPYYLQAIEDRFQKLLTKKIDSYPLSLQKSLGLTISAVVDNEECGKVAGEILSILGFLAPESITKDLIITIMEFEKVELGNIDEEMLLLNDTSITNCSESGEFFNIHRLLQDVLRITLPSIDSEMILRKILSVMRTVYFENTDESDKLGEKIGKERYSYWGHVWRVWEHGIKYKNLIEEFKEFFVDVIHDRIIDKFFSTHFLRKVLPHLDKYYGLGSDLACQIREAVASVLFIDEKYEEYCKFWEAASNVFTSFNPTSQEREPSLKVEATILNARRLMAITFNLGMGEEKQGKYSKAISLYQKIVQNEKYWTNTFLQNPNKWKGLKIENDEIISGPTSLFGDNFPLILQLKSKIVSLLVISNDLDKALAYILKLDENMKEYNSWKNSADFITLAGLQLLRAFGDSEILKTELGRSNRIWALLRYLWDGFVLWSRESDVWQQIFQWTWIDAEYSHKIALSLIESENYEEVVSVYRIQYEIQSRLACLPFESKFNFQEVETWGFVVINKLESLKRDFEAKCVQNFLNRIKMIFSTEDVLQAMEKEVNPGNTNKVGNETAKEEFVLGLSSREPITFIGLNVHGKINSSALKTIHLISVRLYKCEFIWTLNECDLLENLILDYVDINGYCDKRAYLPNLKVFVIKSVDTDKMWRNGERFKYKSEVDIFYIIKMHSFFYRTVENKDWNLNDLKSLQLRRYKVVIPDWVGMEINEQSDSCFVNLFKTGETVELLKVLDLRPTKLLLEYCQTLLNSVIQFGENIKELLLYSVTFVDIKTEIDLCDMIINHLPNLEKLDVHYLKLTPMCMIMCKFPRKLKYLKLSSIIVVPYSATTNDGGNENGIYPRFESLQHLEVSQVFFKDETETELNHLLLKHFPNLQTLAASSTRKRGDKVTELSLDVSILPQNLTKLRIKSVKLIHSTRETAMLNLISISLEDISLSSYNDSELVNLFGNNCENVFLAGIKIELCDVHRLIQNNESIRSICVSCINKKSAGIEIIDWIESLGIKKLEPNFCIERDQGVWKGNGITGFTQVRNKIFN